MAAAAPAGLFSGVWSRIHAAASIWRRRGQAPCGGENNEAEEDEEAAAVRSRLARRAAAARRLGRKLAFVSFNLEVLAFVYAFWRARRRSLTWRLPTQALPMLVIPALATLIYAAFVRFTRKLDLKDKKTLERLQKDKQKTDGEPRELDQNDQNDVQNCDGVDDASNSSVATDSVPHTPKLRKHRQPSINQRDDVEADVAWGHSKDFQPAPSGGLRLRRLSSAKTYMTNSSPTESSEQNTQKTRSISAYSDQHVHVSISTEDTVSYPSDHSRSALSSMLAQPANIPQELPAGDGEEAGFDESWDITDTCSSSSKENLISPAGPHNSFCDRDDSRSSEHAVSYLSTAFQQLLVKVNEEHSLSLQEKLEFSPVFIKEATASPPDEFVSHSRLHLSSDLSDLVPPASETLKDLPAEGVKEKALLAPHASAALQMYSFTSEENPTSCAVDDKELVITSDVETYPLPPICSDVHGNAAIVNIDTVSPKWNLLLKLYGNEVEGTESSKFHIPEESTTPFNLEEVLLCPPSVDTIKHCLGTPEFSVCSQETEKLEVAGSVSFNDDSQELSILRSPELVVEDGEDAIEKKLCELNTKEENAILINMEEALQDPLLVSSTSEQCLEASDVSLCIQDAKIREDFVTANPEFIYPASPELLAEGDEDIKGDKMSDLHLPEQNDLPLNFQKEPTQDSLVAGTAEHLLVTPLYSEEVEITEVHDVVKEGCFESEGNEAFNHQKPVLTPSDDDSNTQYLTSDSMCVQFIPNTDIDEALEGGQEAFSEPLHQSTCHSEESSGEINNDEVYSSNSNAYANVVEDETPFQGLPKFQYEMAISSPDTPIFLDEIKSTATVDIDIVSPTLNLQPELHGEGVEENESSKFHVPEEIKMPFNLEKEVVLCPLAVNNTEHCAGSPEFSICNQESEEMEVAGSVSFIKVSPELSFLSSPELVADGGEDAREKGTDEINTKEENTILINMEEEALQDPLIVRTSTRKQCLEASYVSSCIQDAKAREVPGIVNFVTANPELMYPPSPELLAEDDEDFKEDKMPDLHLPEQNEIPLNIEKEPILDSLVADTAEHFLVTPLYSEEVEITEVHDVIKEGCFESEGNEAFNHQKPVLTPSDDDSNTQYLTSDSMCVQFIPNTDIDEALEGGQEAFSEPLHQSTCHSEEIFLSSGEINNDEVYSSNSNSYANVVEDGSPFGGLSKSQDEMAITFPDTPIFLDEIKSSAIVDIDIISPELSLQPELHGEGVEENESSKYHVPEEMRTPFNLEEEVLLSPLAVNNGSLFKQLESICQSAGTPESSLCNQESEEMEVAGSVSFIKASPELSFLSSPEFVAEDCEDDREKGISELNIKEENETLINLEDQALQGEIVVSTTDQFSLSSQGAKTTEGPEIVSFGTVSPELNCPAFSELIAEAEDLKEDETCDLHLHEQKGLPFNLEKEPFLDPCVVGTAEDALVASDVLLYSEDFKTTEVHGVAKEGLSGSEDGGVFDNRKLVLSSPDDDSSTQNLISNSISAQFIPDSSVKEASQVVQEALSEPPHESTCQSEGLFSSSGEINNDEVKVEVPFAGQEGLFKSEDEMAFTPLDTSIMLGEVTSAENLTDNTVSSLSIPDSNATQSLHEHEQAPSETLQEVTSLFDGSHTSSDEGINSEIFSLYSRSSSCVSEINMLETLRGGTTSEPQNDRDSSFDESNPVTFSSMNSAENYTNAPVTSEIILDTNMTETLTAAEEATVGSLHEDSSNFLGTFVAPDVINDMRESDKHLDLSSSSFAPVVDVFESLQTGQGFSELQYEHDFTVQETPIFPKEVNNAENDFTETIGDPQDSERTSIVALLDEDLTLGRAYMSPEDDGNSLADDHASDLPHMVESHFFSEKLSLESQDHLSSEEILVYADEGSTVENDLGTANSPLCSTEVNLAESRGIDQEVTQQHDETMLGSQDIYMVDQEANAEDLCNNSGSLDIPDVIMADNLQGADILSSEILYDGMSSFEGTLLSLDGHDNAEEDSPNNSGSVMHTAQINRTSLLGLQEGSFKSEDEKEIYSISPYEVDTEETTYSSVFAKDKEPKEDGETKDMKEDVEDMDDDHEVSRTPSDALNVYLLI